MARNNNVKQKRNMHGKDAGKGNLYNHAASARVSESLENTQLNKFGTKGGTGFAGEDANALNEKLRGVKVEQVGAGNKKNGADRISEGIPIQTKYFDSASRTVSAAFDANGVFRYQGMQLEVPSDQYERALMLMKEKITAGKLPGITNPDDATLIVKKGSVTYQQARNIARAGNIDSLRYDAKNNAVTSGYAFAIGFGVSFARAKWQGKSAGEALEEAVGLGFHSAGTSFVAGVVTSQLLRTHSARVGTVVMRKGVKAVADSTLGRAAVNKIASASSGKALYGAAASNHVSKLLRTNVITGVVTTVVATSPDVYRAAISGNTSWAQVGKNLMVNGAGVAAGTAGWMGGAAIGASVGSVIPLVGTGIGAILGGIAGSLAAGSAGSYLGKKALDYVIDDDAHEMLNIIQAELPMLADEYLLTTEEFDALLDHVGEACTTEFLRKMYASDCCTEFVHVQFAEQCLAIIKRRSKVVLPVSAKVQEMLSTILSSDHVDESVGQSGHAVPNFILIGGAVTPPADGLHASISAVSLR
jgi:hypothetical protein